MITLRPIDEVIDFITSFPEPQKILDYKASPALQERIEDLVYKPGSRFSRSRVQV